MSKRVSANEVWSNSVNTLDKPARTKLFHIIEVIKIHDLKCTEVKSPNIDNVFCNFIYMKPVNSIKLLGVTIKVLIIGYSYWFNRKKN